MSNASSPEAPFAVRTVSRQVKGWVDRLGAVWVEGQIVQFNLRSGMAFGVLRDLEENIAIDIAVPAQAIIGLQLEEGARVVVNGKFEFWPKQGRIAFKVREVRLAGLGQLLANLEQLKRRLAAEGLFDQANKRPLPFAPTLIGLICGRDSKAEHDVTQVTLRRWPAAQFTIRNTAVQGTGAAEQVTAALEELDADPAVQVIVIARGGGSLEDLLPFSDENLIRAVAAATTPVVSAIGHEPDAPLLDLVADLRAATPTDAGKRIVPDWLEELALISDLGGRAHRTVELRLDKELAALAEFRSRPALANGRWIIDTRMTEVLGLRRDNQRAIDLRIDRATAELAALVARLETLSPQGTLDRGYALVTKDGSLVSDAAQVAPADQLRIRVAKGAFPAEVLAANKVEA
ncbi:MAG: exodeoxyribonuclease VII large subunit [Bifidobacteriaceae bacterium]|jgi:exodeoxyribonuclease VII large subunit|nr:exodeoxyribonuclease VII large subunit [Bifidobacteriaceae bacterium]